MYLNFKAFREFLNIANEGVNELRHLVRLKCLCKFFVVWCYIHMKSKDFIHVVCVFCIVSFENTSGMNNVLMKYWKMCCCQVSDVGNTNVTQST